MTLLGQVVQANMTNTTRALPILSHRLQWLSFPRDNFSAPGHCRVEHQCRYHRCILHRCPHYLTPPLRVVTLSLHLIGASSSHYTYMDSLWSLACITRPRILAPWLLCPTPICIPALAGSLSTHLDQWFDQFILSGLSLGFRIGVSASPQALGVIPRNHPSSTQCPDAVSQYITSECAAEQMVGPLPTWCRVTCTSALLAWYQRGGTLGGGA